MQDEKSRLIKSWRREIKTTRAVISRIPENSDYRPDPKSRPAREIAWQIVIEERLLLEGLERGRIEWADIKPPATMKEILAAYDEQISTFVARLEALQDETWENPVPFLFGGQPVSNSRGIDSGWGFLFDIVHHRGQITTYLRAMGSTVPQIYGPTADEP